MQKSFFCALVARFFILTIVLLCRFVKLTS
jgi:hypothetical protein